MAKLFYMIKGKYIYLLICIIRIKYTNTINNNNNNNNNNYITFFFFFFLILLFLMNIHSSNGTYINHNKIKKTSVLLNNNDKIIFVYKNFNEPKGK